MAGNIEQTNTLHSRLTSLVEPVVTDLALELVEVQFRREANGWVLRLIIDTEDGVSLDDCTAVSREVGRLLEVEDPIEHTYRLEVSSPGLERPLTKEKDYLRFLHRKAKIKTREPIDNQRIFVGTIENLHNKMLTLQTDRGEIKLPLDMIAKARLVFEM
jgi:ribosome maturation factor RimP